MDNELIGYLSLCFDKTPEEAIKFLESKGIKITWDWKGQLDAIRQQCFTVAKVTSADILQMFLDELNKALEEGKTYQEFKKDIVPLLEQKGYQTREDGTAWRLDTIYRTNLQSSYMAGRWEKMKEVQDSFPYWEFVAVQDNRTTSGCSGLNGTILPSNDQFWKTNYPPRHYNCRSRVRAVSKFQMDKRNLNVNNSNDFKDIKPADGFDTNPGEWKPDLNQYDPALRNSLESIMGSFK